MATEAVRLPGGALSPAEGGNVYIRRYLNARVTIHYVMASGYSDTGRISYIDGYWVELTKDNNDILLIPISAVRIIKLIDHGVPEGDAGILLRPSEERKLEERKLEERK